MSEQRIGMHTTDQGDGCHAPAPIRFHRRRHPVRCLIFLKQVQGTACSPQREQAIPSDSTLRARRSVVVYLYKNLYM